MSAAAIANAERARMVIPRHPPLPIVTIFGSACAVLLTLASHGSAHAWPTWPALSWAVHADVRHLIHDVGVLLLLGGWVELRAGAARTAVWLVAGVTASHLLHALCYAGHGALFGLSAAAWTIAGAGIAGCISTARARAAAILIMGAVLVVECFTPWREVLGLLSLGVGEPMRVGGVELSTVPLVHQGCAGVGILMGWAMRVAKAQGQG